MRRLFPRTHTALVLLGYEPERASLILRDARRGDGVAMMAVRLAAQLQRPTQRLLVLVARLSLINDHLRQLCEEGL
jgi:hypothetical protein